MKYVDILIEDRVVAKEEIAWLPKQCELTGNRLWLRKVVKLRLESWCVDNINEEHVCIWTGRTRYHTPKEHTAWMILQ